MTAKPTPDPTKDVWGAALNAALDAIEAKADTNTASIGTLSSTVSTNSSAITALQTSKADASSVYTKTAADGRFVRTINGGAPDGSGNVIVSPVPGIRSIYWDGTGSQPLRSTQSTDLTQPVIWITPLASPPSISTGYAVNGDLWFVL